MLQEMRKYTKSWLGIGIIGVPVVLSFVVWGIADVFRGNTDTSIATVGGVKIPMELFQRDYRNVTRQATRKGALSPAQTKTYSQQVLNGLVDQTALDNYIDRYGVTATDATVSARIRAIPNFTGPLGTFDHNTFLRLIDQSGFTEQSFIEYVRGALERDQFLSAAGSGFVLPSGYAMALFNYLNEARMANYFVLPASAAGSPPKPTDSQLEAFVKAYPHRFSTPEYREVAFAWISPSDLEGQIKVSDTQLRQQYELQKEQYQIPEKRELEQIAFPDLASAKAARAKIASGESFADIAKARHLAPADIQIGTLAKADLGERGAAVFALPQGGVSQPLKAPVGYALVHVVGITPGSSKSFDDVKGGLRKQIVAQLAAAKISDISNAYIDENSRGENLVQSAKKAGMHAGHVAAVDAHGDTPQETKADIPSDPEFLAQIFKAEVGEEGDPFQTKSGATYVVKVNGVQPPKLKPLDAVRAQATAAWQKEQMETRLKVKAKDLAAQASSQKSLVSVAAAVGASVQKSGPLRRPSRGKPTAGPFPSELLTKVFGVPAGQAVYGATADGKSYIVAKVTAVAHPPESAARPARMRRFAMQVGRQVGGDIADSSATAARAQEGVTINRQAVDRLTGEGS